MTSPIWCFAKRTEVVSSETIESVYAGSGPGGKVLRSTDLKSWEEYMSVDDCHVRAITVWANALFMGTQPNGRIYAHNFTTGESYLFVETEDSAVVSFASFKGKLYAGTQPAGIVYGFDGTTWKEEHRPYGLGVTTMVASDSQLVVFSKGAEGPVVFDGKTWKTMPMLLENGQGQTVASFRSVSGDIYDNSGLTPIVPSSTVVGNDARTASPVNPQFNLSAATLTAKGIVSGGTSNGMVISISDNDVAKVVDVGVPVNGIININDQAFMVSSGGTVFLVTGGTT